MTIMTAAGWVPDPSKDFGARLALVRQHHGWNIRAAATVCGLDPESWRGWETLGRRPRDLAAVCEAVAAGAGCDPVWLLLGRTFGGPTDGTAAQAHGPDGGRPVAGAGFEPATSGTRVARVIPLRRAS